MEWNIIDDEPNADDVPVGARDGDLEFKVEIAFHELEIVAYVGDLKIIGSAHFGASGRASSQRSSDYLRHFTDSRLTLSNVRVFRHATNEQIDAAPFIILNLDRIELVYAREVADAVTGDPALGAKPQPASGDAGGSGPVKA
jgi:hypothetical protein